MQQHDIYLVVGVLLFFLGLAGYFTAKSEGSPIWSSVLMFSLGISGVAYSYVLNDHDLTIRGFVDSTLRIVAAIF